MSFVESIISLRDNFSKSGEKLANPIEQYQKIEGQRSLEKAMAIKAMVVIVLSNLLQFALLHGDSSQALEIPKGYGALKLQVQDFTSGGPQTRAVALVSEDQEISIKRAFLKGPPQQSGPFSDAPPLATVYVPKRRMGELLPKRLKLFHALPLGATRASIKKKGPSPYEVSF